MQIRQTCICILAAVIACTASGSILIVIGDVSENSARILYDALDRSLVGSVVESRLYDENGLVLKETLRVNEAPRVWRLNSLTAGKQYRIEFQPEHGDIVFGRFRTLSQLDENIRILAASCNNLLEDNDSSFLAELTQNDLVKNRIGMIHLGDQLYADFIYNDWVKNGRRSSSEDLVNEFRNAYRKIWSVEPMRTLLSTGANWMVIDDHDIVNNLDPRQFDDGRGPLLEAGRQVFLEYQLQLQFDIFDEDGEVIGTLGAYYTKELGHLALIFTDTRLERTFSFDSNAPFLGMQQSEFISKSLEAFSQRDDITKILLISSVPLVWAPAVWVVKLPDIAERERMALHPDHRQECVNLLNLASQYGPKVALLSGDIHLFFHSEICHRSRPYDRCIEQMITSGLTVASTAVNSLKVLCFHFLALGVGSNVVDDWTLHPKELNVGHNAVILESSKSNFSWIPIFSQHASLWNQIVQFVFPKLVSLSSWSFYIVLCLLLGLCLILYTSRKKSANAKAKSN